MDYAQTLTSGTPKSLYVIVLLFGMRWLLITFSPYLIGHRQNKNPFQVRRCLTVETIYLNGRVSKMRSYVSFSLFVKFRFCRCFAFMFILLVMQFSEKINFI